MGMTGQDPTGIRFPPRKVRSIGIVAEYQGGGTQGQLPEASRGVKTVSPEIVQTNDVKPADLCNFISDTHHQLEGRCAGR